MPNEWIVRTLHNDRTTFQDQDPPHKLHKSIDLCGPRLGSNSASAGACHTYS
ncbi:hypothetical protein HanXRQr2_Chr15g0676391 [Helianthus annuus]|uniref:Uncharacterized protein n=1 Tax=Helianthus annuus TaxID=4232 RepID=A0A9K3DZD1_HELAN|nr:hypothetical protein HanXRQr2_Chr15g0676391 [Helianthus annuus]